MGVWAAGAIFVVREASVGIGLDPMRRGCRGHSGVCKIVRMAVRIAVSGFSGVSLRRQQV
jgi:hypothetical protein